MNETYIGSEERLQMYGDYRTGKINCVNRVLGGRHVLVVGETGSGKTYWMAKVSAMLPAFVFVNPQEERIVDSITQVVTEDPNDVIKGLEEGYRRVQFIPDEDEETAIAQVKTIRLDLWDVARGMNVKDGEWWMNLIVDEAEIFAPLNSRTDLQNLARRGRRYGVKGWFLSQQPQDLAKGIVNNTTHTVLFQLGTWAQPYYSRFHIPIEEEKEWLEQKYHYVVWDKRNMVRCEPI